MIQIQTPTSTGHRYPLNPGRLISLRSLRSLRCTPAALVVDATARQFIAGARPPLDLLLDGLSDSHNGNAGRYVMNNRRQSLSMGDWSRKTALEPDPI